MAILDHITYQVEEGSLFHDDGKATMQYTEFFVDLLGLKEIDPEEGIEGKGWNVRWFEDTNGMQIHLVETKPEIEGIGSVDLGLGHFCAIIDRGAYARALNTSWREAIGSLEGRCWLKGPGGIRVEARPVPLGRKARVPAGEEGEPVPVLEGPLPTDQALEQVFARCLAIFRERNAQHNDSWKREGWRGCLFNLRRKAERAWDHLWNFDRNDLDSDYLQQHVDDLLDSVNYAALTVLAVEEGNRDGQGGWWPED